MQLLLLERWHVGMFTGVFLWDVRSRGETQAGRHRCRNTVPWIYWWCHRPNTKHTAKFGCTVHRFTRDINSAVSPLFANRQSKWHHSMHRICSYVWLAHLYYTVLKSCSGGGFKPVFFALDVLSVFHELKHVAIICQLSRLRRYVRTYVCMYHIRGHMWYYILYYMRVEWV